MHEEEERYNSLKPHPCPIATRMQSDALRIRIPALSAPPPCARPLREGFIAEKGFVSVEVGAHTHMVLEARNAKFGWRVVEREEVGGLAVAVSVVRGV